MSLLNVSTKVALGGPLPLHIMANQCNSRGGILLLFCFLAAIQRTSHIDTVCGNLAANLVLFILGYSTGEVKGTDRGQVIVYFR